MHVVDADSGTSTARRTDRPQSGRWWFTPAVLIIAPVVLSFLAWVLLIAFRGRIHGVYAQLSGFLQPAAITAPGVALLLGWYTTVILLATFGWRRGASVEPSDAAAAITGSATFERRYFFLLLAAAGTGVGYAYAKIASSTSIIDSLTSQTGNTFTDALSNSAGPATLRYAAILAAPVGVHLWRKKSVNLVLPLIAVGLLGLNSLIASRMSLLMAVVVYIAIWVADNRGQPSRGSRMRKTCTVVIAAALMFGLLTGLNFVRNGNYYREAGVTAPVAMNAYQMGSYLAVPAQVSVGVADGVMRGAFESRGGPGEALDAITPTFFVLDKVAKADAMKNPGTYDSTVSFVSNFTTNSVFADVYAEFGLWGWLFTLALYPIAGYLFGRASRYGPVIAGSGGVMAYCLVEVWRVQLLNQGIVIFLLLLTVAAAALTAVSVRATRPDHR